MSGTQQWEFESAEFSGHDQFKDYAAIIATVMDVNWSCSLKYLKHMNAYRLAFYPRAFEQEDADGGWVGLFATYEQFKTLRVLPLAVQRKVFADLFEAFAALWELRFAAVTEAEMLTLLETTTEEVMPEGWAWAIGFAAP